MNVLIVYPPNTRRTYLSRFALTEPLTGLFLGPVLRDRHAVRLIDLRVTPDLGRELGGFEPDAVVIAASPCTQGSLDGLLTLLKMRAPEARTLLVGAAEYGATHVQERPLDYAHPLLDAIVPGFYLYRMQTIVPRVLDTWADGREVHDLPGLWVRGPHLEWTCTGDVDYPAGDVGVPDRALLGRARGRYRLGGLGNMAYVFYTDGCPFNCRFCTMSKNGNDIFVRSLPDVLEELKGVTEPNVFIADFEPLQSPEAMLRLADSIQAEGIRKNYYMLTRADSVINQTHVLERWKEIGLKWVFLGLDGHSALRLRQIHKGSSVATHEAALATLARLGLGVAVGMTVPPDFGLEDFQELARAVKKMPPTMIDFTVETPLPGTRLFDETEHRLTTRDWGLFDLQHAVLPTTLPLPQFYREMLKLHLLAWRRSSRSVWKHHPLRDMVHNAGQAPGAFWSLARAHKDHGSAALARSATA